MKAKRAPKLPSKIDELADADLEKRRAYHREWQRRSRAADPEKYLEYMRAWRKKNAKKMKTYARDRARKLRKEDPAKVNASQREDYQRHHAKRRAKKLEWERSNPERRSAHARAWRKKHGAKFNAEQRQWRKDNPELWKQMRDAQSHARKRANAKWYKKNAREIKRVRQSREYKKRAALNRRLLYKKSPNFRLRVILGSQLRWALQQQGAKRSVRALELVGCTIDELRAYLEGRFKPGMSWKNYGTWHIDHIRPCASFDLSSIDEQRKCFHFHNLQPLWAVENLRKGKKYEPA